ncbi:MAG: RHS repeat-associated core domain-containing protein [Casimicrobiaceae bacterium]
MSVTNRGMRAVARVMIVVFGWSSILPATMATATAAPMVPLDKAQASAPPKPASRNVVAPIAAADRPTLRQAYVPKFFVPGSKVRAPYLSAADFPKVSGKSVLKAVRSKAGGDPELSETEEVVLTPAIRALAETLGKNPARIYYWVRNNVEFVPTYGSVQGAQGTLELRRGNAYDIASLAIALLRASDVPARYAYGTIELPAAVANNWVGGATNGLATSTLLGQGGIPHSVLVASGQVTALQVEHVWVEAKVDFNPSRGAVTRAAATWVPIDASFKQNTLIAGLQGASLGGYNASVVANTANQGASVDANGATHLNSVGLGTAYNSFVSQAQGQIAGAYPNATVGQVLGSRAIVGEDFPILMGTLPFKTVVVLGRFTAIPEDLQWKVRYGVYASDIDRAQEHPLASLEKTVASIAGHRVTIGFAPSTASEKQVLDGLLLQNPFPSTLPGYQVRMKAQLSVDGVAAGEGGEFLMGTRLVGGGAWRSPKAATWIQTASHDIIAGETHAIVVSGHGVSSDALAASRDRAAAVKAKLAAQDYAGLTQAALTGELLHFAGLAYSGTVEGNARVLREASGVLGSVLPSIVRASTVAAVTYSSGAPQSVAFPGVAIDTVVLPNTSVAKDANAARAVGVQRLLGARASAYAQLVAERIFADAAHPGEGTSGVKALSRANDAGVKLYTVNSANLNTVLPQLLVDAATKDVVAQATGAARRVGVTGATIPISAWSGAGYAIDDPDSGTTEYEITGRYTGAVHPAGGLLPLALAGHAVAAGRGSVAAANLDNALGTPADLTAAVNVLNADYRGIAWANWAGAPSVLSAWWLSLIDNGASPLLGGSLATIVDGLVAQSVTSLTGAPLPNNAPHFTSQPVTAAAIGQGYQYLASATDPDGDALVFSLGSGPSGLTVSSAGLVAWASPAAGAHQVVVRVSDGKVSVDQSYVLTVGESLPLDMALAVTPKFVNAGDTVTITVGTVGGRGPVTRTLKVDGATVSLNANGQALITAAGVGGHNVEATATDGIDTVKQYGFYAIGDPADTTDPTATIISPENDSEVTAPVNIVGTASDARLAEWTLMISPRNLGQFSLIARGTQPVVNGTLGRFNPTTLANGIYDVVLRVVDANGRETFDSSTYEVTENLKLGQFSVSFLDVSVDAAGIPVQVTRTYDTRRKVESLDFGYGWTVDYQNVKLQKNLSTGLGWVVITQGLQNCVRPTGKRKVNVTLPDGRVERFEARNHQECGLGFVPPIEIDFLPVGKTTSTLEIPAGDIPALLAQGGDLIDSGTALPWNPKRFRLTTLERFVYELDESFGIRKVTDPNGNTLTYDANGIVHSAGSSVAFTRDAQGRIATITDPNGKRLTYAYDGAGNLATVTDRSNAQSVLKYDRLHTLTSYTDPRGVQLVRNEYDDQGRLVAQYDAAGAKIDLAARDADAGKEVVKNRRGNTTSYEYDSIGNVTRMVDAANGITSYTYDARGNEATVSDPLGHVTEKTFDSTDNPLTEKDPEGNTTGYTWTAGTRDLTKIIDARGNETNIVYTVTGNLGILIDPENNETRLGYGPGGIMTFLRDGAGNETTYEYDAKGRRTKETDPAGGVTTYAYDENGNATTVTRTRTVNGVPVTHTTQRVFDADGNVVSETDPQGRLSRTTYNGLKKVAAQVDPLNRTTAFDYDERGFDTRVTHPDGLAEEKSYDPNGNESTMKDRAGRVTANTYDALDRLTKVTYPDGKFVENGYDAAGRLTSVKDERGNTTAHEYDRAGRRTKTTDAEGGVWLYEYDPNGNLTKATDPRLGATTHTYDKANRRTRTTYPLTPPDTVALFETWEYDGAGRRIAWTDTAGRRTAYGYDGLGRLKTVTQPAPDGTTTSPGLVTTYGYDEVGNKTTQTDALGRITRWEYDALGRTTKRTLPGGQFESFTYDAVGNVASQTNFRGETIAFSYDVLNRLSTKTLPGNNTVTYTYTATGQVATVTDVRGLTSYVYDARDRVTQVSHPEGWVVGYTYDAAGNRATVTTQFRTEPAKTVAYEYDRANRLSKVTSAEGEVTTYTYDAAGNRKTASMPDGIAITWSYDTRNRVARIEHKQVSTGTIVASYDYLWNAQGLRSRVVMDGTAGGCTTDYSYDALGRLTAAQTSTNCTQHVGSWNYVYDAVGNRLSESGATSIGISPTHSSSFTYDVNDRLIAATGTKAATYEYDAAGNVTKKTETNVFGIPEETTYGWDAEGRMVSALPKLIITGGNTTEQPRALSYLYDPEGQLVREVRAGTIGQDPPPANVTFYLADKNLPFSQILEERDGAGVLKAAYTFGDAPIKQVAGGVTSFFHGDHMSTKFIAAANGDVQARFSYSPYGETKDISGGATSLPVATTVYQFAGERLNADTGLYYNRARWMDPGVGRFESADPLSGLEPQPITLQDYLYANADPSNTLDPSGTTGIGDISVGTSGQSGMSAAANISIRKAFSKMGCELGMAIADQAIEYGIYILFDGANFYVGQAKDIDARYQKHLNEAKNDVRKAWKSGMQVVARFGTAGGKDALRIMEQYVIDAMTQAGHNLKNGVQAIDKSRGRLRKQYSQFLTKVCK